MRHKVYGKHLGRNKNQRTALFKSLVRSLILSEKIETTESKAKAIKGLVDKIINQAKGESTRRLVVQFLTDKNVQEKLINDIAPRLSGRNSGYTSTVRLGRRLGDGAMIVQMSLLVEGSKKKEAKAVEKEVETEKVIEVKEPKAAKPKAKKTATKKETKK